MTLGQALAVLRNREQYARQVRTALHAAAALESRARELQRPDIEQRAHEQRVLLSNLWAEFTRWQLRLDTVMSYIPGPGLGAVPVVIPVAVASVLVAAAVAFAAIFRKATAAEGVVRALAAGLVTPDEAAAIVQGLPDEPAGLLGGVTGLVKAVLVAGVAWVAYSAAMRAKGGRTWE